MIRKRGLLFSTFAALVGALLALGLCAVAAVAAEEPAPGETSQGAEADSSSPKDPAGNAKPEAPREGPEEDSGGAGSADSPKRPNVVLTIYRDENGKLVPVEGDLVGGGQSIWVGVEVTDPYFKGHPDLAQDRDVVEIVLNSGGKNSYKALTSKHFKKVGAEGSYTYRTPASSKTHLAEFRMPKKDGAKVSFTARQAEAIVDQDNFESNTVERQIDFGGPTFTGISYVPPKGHEDELSEEGGRVEAVEARTISVSAKDVVPEGNSPSELRGVSAKYGTRYVGRDLQVVQAGDHFDIKLSQPNEYNMRFLFITATDKLGNETVMSAQQIRKKTDSAGFFPGIVYIMSKEDSDVQVMVGEKVVAGKGAAQAAKAEYVAADSSVWVRSRKPDFVKNLEAAKKESGKHVLRPVKLVNVERRAHKEQVGPIAACEVPANAKIPARTKGGYYYYKCPDRIFGVLNSPDVKMRQRNAQYKFSSAPNSYVGSFNSGSVVLDGKAPQAKFKSGPAKGGHNKFIPKIGELNTRKNPYKKFSALVVSQKEGGTQFELNFRDILPEGQLSLSDINSLGWGSDMAGTSGLNRKTLKITLPAPTDLTGKQIGKKQTLKPQISDDNLAKFDIPAEGLYRMDKIIVHVADNAGQVLSTPLSKLMRQNGKYDVLVVDRGETSGKGAQLEVKKAKKTPVSAVPEVYYRGEVDISFTVPDRWFPLYVKQEKLSADLLVVELNETPLATPHDYKKVPARIDPSKFVPAGENKWRLTGFRLPRAKGNAKLPKEGAYNLKWHYTGFSANSENSEGARYFTVDYTGPKFGGLHFSPVEPVHAPWIFSSSAFEATLGGIEDPVSGVKSNSAGFKKYKTKGAKSAESALGFSNERADAERNPKPKLKYEGDKRAGKLSFRITGDSQRLRFDETAIGLVDNAGNPADTGYLGEYNNSNLPKDKQGRRPVGVVIDTTAPTVNVHFDNNSPRNEKYFNSDRIGTFTIKESNFDLMRQLDSQQVVITNSRDGKTSTVPVSAFENPSKDGQTWVYRQKYDSDGDWKISAEITDLAGHKSDHFETDFVLDKTQPQLTVTFDNTHPTNGMYYNHPRTATITVVDRNFSGADSPVRVAARNDAGQPSPAPGGNWAKIGPDTWSMNIPFTVENHYALAAAATDMAGNTAEEIKEPEFVIDMTKPEVKIDGVENMTAYAGTVRPSIVASDTNLDHSRVEYRLNGNYRGVVTDLFTRTKESDNDATITYDDFERDPKVDDIYSLRTRVTDMAGNYTEVVKTFSVNRFGSTYKFEAKTGDLRGRYLDKPQNIEVTEVNVSGLENNLTEVELAKNDSLQKLDPKSYSRVAGSTKAGWSTTKYTLPAKLFDSAGYYRVLFSSIDKAGNLSQNNMEKKNEARNGAAELKFAIDKQKPQVRTGSIESDEVYYASGKNIDVNAKDNLALAQAQLEVDGQVVRTWDGEELERDLPTYKLAADAHEHDVTLRVQDKAGNESVASYNNVVVATNFWRYLLANPLLLAGVLVGGALIVIALVALVAALISRNRRLSYRRNPFGV